jgi:hypothetical protein
MDLHITSHSTRTLPNTNLRDCDVKVVLLTPNNPTNVDLEKRAKAALGDLICQEETLHPTLKVEFVFNLGVVSTKTNLWYMFLQLLKDKILNRRLDVLAFRKRVLEFDKFTSKDIGTMLALFIRVRFFKIMKQEVHILCVKRSAQWDLHLVQDLREETLDFHAALVGSASKKRFLYQHRALWKVTLVQFIRHMLSKDLGFSSDLPSLVATLKVGKTSLAWSLKLANDPSHYVVLRRPYDAEALLIWHMILIDDYFDNMDFPRVFEKEIKEYFAMYGVDYMKNRVLKSIPDVWHRMVPKKYRLDFRPGT